MTPADVQFAGVGITAPAPHELCTMNFSKLFSVVLPVVTVTNPSLAPAGTVARMKVVPVRVWVAAVTPLNFTTDDALNPWPKMPIFDPTQSTSYLRDFMVFFRPGDIVKFRPINRDGYDQAVEDVDKGRFAPPIREVSFDLRQYQADIDGYNAKLEGALHGH